MVRQIQTFLNRSFKNEYSKSTTALSFMVLYLKLRQRREYTINLRTHKLKSFLLI
jgi:hypothetical protein